MSTHSASASGASAASSRRNPRTGRSAPQKKRSRRKRKSRSLLLPWQWAALAGVLLAIIAAFVCWGMGKSRLNALRADRERERQRYEQQVVNHRPKYRELIEQYAAEYDLNPAFVSAIIKNESNYDPRAVSSKGAMGLMQFMPDTFDWVKKNCGYRGADASILYEPEAAIKMGCYLLRYICRQLGTDDPVLVTCAYHAGWGNISSWVKNYSSDGVTLAVSEIPKSDTRTYAGRVINSYAIYLQHYY